MNKSSVPDYPPTPRPDQCYPLHLDDFYNTHEELTLTIDSKNLKELQKIADSLDISLAEAFGRALALYKLAAQSEHELALVDALGNPAFIKL